MRTFLACCVALLIATGFNLKVSAQGGVIIQGGPEVKIKKEVEKKIRKKSDHQVERRIVIRGDGGEERIVELDGRAAKTSEGGYEVIDLGDGRQARITIRKQDEKSAPAPTLRWATPKRGAEATIDVEIDDGHEGHVHDSAANRWVTIERDGAWVESHAGKHGSQSRMLILKGHQNDEDEDDDEISISIEGLEPLLGLIMQHIDLEEVGPMIGALLGDMNVEVEIEDGRIEIEAEGLHGIMKQPGLHQILLQHLGHGGHAAHGHGHHEKPKHHDLLFHQDVENDFTIGGIAPGAYQVVVTEAPCECECACACCKAGKCATPKKAPKVQFFGHDLEGRVIAPEGFHFGAVAPGAEAPKAVRRRVATLAEPGAPEAGRRAIATLVDPSAPKAVRRAIAVVPTPKEGSRRTVTSFGVSTDEAGRYHRAPTPKRPRGGDMDDIEERLDRLSAEMKALRKELRALRRKI